MVKVDIMLNIVLASIPMANNPAVNNLYANLCITRNTLQWICEGQPDNGDVMAADAVTYALGNGPKPLWMAQAGL